MELLEYQGDLLEAPVDAIVHQTNCVSHGAAGLAAAVFGKHPEANTYHLNRRVYLFGSYEAFIVDNAPYRMVVNCFSQVNTGPPSEDLFLGLRDNATTRLEAVRVAVQAFVQNHPGVKSIAFPRYFGCALAGGKWDDYYFKMKEFARTYPHVQFHIIEKV
jgi:hypothetical protein